MSWNPPPDERHSNRKEWEKTTEDKEQPPGRNDSPPQTKSQLHYSDPHVKPTHPHQPQVQHPLPPHLHHSPHHHPYPHTQPPQPSQTPHLPPIQQERPAIEQPEMYAASEPMYQYRIPPHQLPGFQQSNFQQPAPRQRTAIACRYCRRRKIRCSGFESSPDGRCANCLRFNQECVFTPVSSQTQAFVPAHAVYPGRSTGGRGGPLYGAHGQPLPPNYNAMPMPLQAPVSSAQSSMEFRSSQKYSRPPSPGAGPNRPPPPPPAQPHYGSYEEPMAYEPERNRSQEPRPSLLPPPVPGNQPPQPRPLQRRSSAGEYQSHHAHNDPPSPSSHLLHAQHAYSPPPVSGPPSSSFQASSYAQGPPPSAASNYYPPGPGASQQRTRSPVGFHSSDRSSGSPHPFHPPMHPPPPRPASSGPSPSSPNTHSIPSMQMGSLIDPSQPHGRGGNQRTAADGDMLDRLMPRSGL
ncbi:unnamed protein product [Tuber aestivum]|uniref:Zn(2)-C6 fungal-type domain-containing protein n=1 Tax=Tuber aestivum TaxID=59557 RepID=A0A292PSG6_9PEZI|nr:unnamed protein product [Tuber aestivum]